jgi:hypothetical protein
MLSVRMHEARIVRAGPSFPDLCDHLLDSMPALKYLELYLLGTDIVEDGYVDRITAGFETLSTLPSLQRINLKVRVELFVTDKPLHTFRASPTLHECLRR